MTIKIPSETKHKKQRWWARLWRRIRPRDHRDLVLAVMLIVMLLAVGYSVKLDHEQQQQQSCIIDAVGDRDRQAAKTRKAAVNFYDRLLTFIPKASDLPPPPETPRDQIRQTREVRHAIVQARNQTRRTGAVVAQNDLADCLDVEVQAD